MNIFVKNSRWYQLVELFVNCDGKIIHCFCFSSLGSIFLARLLSTIRFLKVKTKL